MNSYTSRLVTASHRICYENLKVVGCVHKYMKAIFLDDFSFAIVQSQVYLRGLVRGSMYKVFAHKLPPLDKLLILTILHIKILGNEIAN